MHVFDVAHVEQIFYDKDHKANTDQGNIVGFKYVMNSSVSKI